MLIKKLNLEFSFDIISILKKDPRIFGICPREERTRQGTQLIKKKLKKKLTRATRVIPNIQLHKKLIDKNRLLNVIKTAIKQSLESSVYLYSTYTRYNDKP